MKKQYKLILVSASFALSLASCTTPASSSQSISDSIVQSLSESTSQSSSESITQSSNGSKEETQEITSAPVESSQQELTSETSIEANAPVYKGMTISHPTLEAIRPKNHKARPNIIKNDKGNTNNNGNHYGWGNREHDTEIEEDIEELVGIEIIEDSETRYFVKPGEVFIIEVHLSNPNDFEIQSFTLNGKKYSSYMFEPGSTMELLRLAVTAPNEPGIEEYTIDAIKYIEGTSIKDVRMNGERTIKAGFTYPDAPSAQIECTPSTTSLSFSIDVSDPWSRIQQGSLYFYVTDGQSYAYSTPLSIGHSTIDVSSLRMSTAYQYGVVSVYDLLDGAGLHSDWLITDTSSTLSAVLINISEVKDESISFEAEINPSCSISNLAFSLYDETTGMLISTGDENTRQFENLLSNHDYSIYADYEYQSGETNLRDWVSSDVFTTIPKSTPTLQIASLIPTKSGFSYQLVENDTSNVGYIANIKLIDQQNTIDLGTDDNGSVDTLLSNHEYVMSVDYRFDLNDGEGERSATYETTFTTLAKETPNININGNVAGRIANYFLSLSDPDSVTDIEKIELIDESSGSVVETKEDGQAFGSFTDLLTGHNYYVKATLSIDYTDGNPTSEETRYWYFSTQSVNAPTLEFAYSSAGKRNVSYGLDLQDEAASVTEYRVELLNGETVENAKKNVISGSFENLLSNHNYGLRATATYDLHDGFGPQTIVRTTWLDTQAMAVPSFEFDMPHRDDGVISYSFDIDDEDQILEVSKVALLANGEEVQTKEDGLGSGKFTSLSDDQYYDIKVYYSYDMNEGEGPQNCTLVRPVAKKAVCFDEDGETVLHTGYYDPASDKTSYDGLIPTKENDVENNLQFVFDSWDTISNNAAEIKIKASYDSCSIGLEMGIDSDKSFARVNRYVGDAEEVVLPTKWCGLPVTGIDDDAFSGNIDIETITIPEGYVDIGNNAFFQCSSLANVSFPNTLKTIGSSAFQECSSLDFTLPEGLETIGYHGFQKTGITNLVVPESIKKLEEGAFSECENLISVRMPKTFTSYTRYIFASNPLLESIYIPKEVETIDETVFDNCPSLVVYCEGSQAKPGWNINIDSIRFIVYSSTEIGVYEENGLYYAKTKIDDVDGVTIVGYDEDTNITSIPATIAGLPVLAIGPRAFYECNTLKTIVLPDSLRRIDEKAFSQCDKLVSVVLPEGIDVIKKETFIDCRSLKNINFPSSLLKIEDHVFEHCFALQSINLNDGLTYIGSYAFENCVNLTSVTIPNSVITVSDYAFDACFNLFEAYLPSSVVTVGENAFATQGGISFYCEPSSKPAGWNRKWTDSEHVYWGIVGSEESVENGFRYRTQTLDGVTSSIIVGYVGEKADLVIPSTLGGNQVRIIGRQAFRYCNWLKSLVIADGVERIEEEAFMSTGLMSVVIPNTVTFIGYQAFAYSNYGSYITIPSSVEYIEAHAFDYSAWKINCVAESKPTGWDDEWAGKSPNVSWGFVGTVEQDGVTYHLYEVSGNKTASAAFANKELRYVVFAATVDGYALTRIRSGVFTYESSTKVTFIPSSVITIDPDAILTYGTIYCESDSKPATWKDGWVSSGATVYWGCDGIVIQDGLVYLLWENNDEKTAYLIDKIDLSSNVVIPESVGDYSVTLIAASAFKEHIEIESVTIPGSVVTIEEGAFSGCNSMTSLTLSSGLTSIGKDAFNGCEQLALVSLPGSLISIGEKAFHNCSSLSSVTMSEGLATIGNEAFAGCSALASIILPESLISIGEGAFYYCESLSTVTMAEGLTTIGEEAFRGCFSLKAIILPNSAISIGDGAFFSCNSLSSVTLGTGITSIPDDMFHGCSELRSINLPESLVSIGKEAFRGCYGLSSIVIPESVESIADEAFIWCSGLKLVTIPVGVTAMGRKVFANIDSLIVRCIAESKPEGWSEAWSEDVLRVDWGVRLVGDLYYAVAGEGEQRHAIVIDVNGNPTSVVIPDAINDIPVTVIVEHAFKGCSSLTSLVIPESIAKIGYQAFASCDSLIMVRFMGDLPSEMGSDVFAFTWDSESLIIYVPGEYLDNYLNFSDTDWQTYGVRHVQAYVEE